MNNQTLKPKPAVAYVRLSTYQVGYFKTRYGCPALFPNFTALSLCLDRYLVPNPTMAPLTAFSYSEAVFDQSKFGGLFAPNSLQMTDAERAEYLPIELPAEVLRPKGVEKTSCVWQLSAVGAKHFRRQAKREFWIALSQFYDECKYRAARDNSTVTFEDVATDFLLSHGIELHHLDTIYRTWQRTRKEIKAQIESHRALIEERGGEALAYTA